MIQQALSKLGTIKPIASAPRDVDGPRFTLISGIINKIAVLLIILGAVLAAQGKYKAVAFGFVGGGFFLIYAVASWVIWPHVQVNKTR